MDLKELSTFNYLSSMKKRINYCVMLAIALLHLFTATICNLPNNTDINNLLHHSLKGKMLK